MPLEANVKVATVCRVGDVAPASRLVLPDEVRACNCVAAVGHEASSKSMQMFMPHICKFLDRQVSGSPSFHLSVRMSL